MYFHHNTVGPMPNSQIENIERGREKDLRQQYKTHRFIYIQKKHHFFKHLLRENCLRDDCCAKDKWLNELYQIAQDLRSEIFDGDKNLVAHSSHPNLSFVWINFHFSVIYLYFLVCLFSFCTHFKPNASRQREWKKKKKTEQNRRKSSSFGTVMCLFTFEMRPTINHHNSTPDIWQFATAIPRTLFMLWIHSENSK